MTDRKKPMIDIYPYYILFSASYMQPFGEQVVGAAIMFAFKSTAPGLRDLLRWLKMIADEYELRSERPHVEIRTWQAMTQTEGQYVREAEDIVVWKHFFARPSR